MASERDILSSLSSFLGAGMGDDDTTPEQFAQRIRWGVEHQIAAAIQRAADVVEEASKRPGSCTWGQLRTRILLLMPKQIGETNDG